MPNVGFFCSSILYSSIILKSFGQQFLQKAVVQIIVHLELQYKSGLPMQFTRSSQVSSFKQESVRHTSV